MVIKDIQKTYDRLWKLLKDFFRVIFNPKSAVGTCSDARIIKGIIASMFENGIFCYQSLFIEIID